MVSPDSTAVYVTGTAPTTTAGLNIYTIAYTASAGATQWAKYFAGEPGTGNDQVAAVAVRTSGGSQSGVYVAGTGTGTTPDGDALEVVAHFAEGTGNGGGSVGFKETVTATDAQAQDIVVSPTLAAFFTGQASNGSGHDLDYLTAEHFPERNFEYDGSGGGDDSAYTDAVSPDGSTLYVTGQSDGTTTGQDYTTVAYTVVAP